MKKKGVELSLSFLVVLVIAVAILILGIRFIDSIASETIELDKITTDQLDKKFAELSCSASDRVCIGIIKKVIAKGNFDAFGMKIINIDDMAMFKVVVTRASAFDLSEKEILNNIDFKYNPNPVEIEKNEEKSLGIGFEVPKDAVSGTYIFDVLVEYNVDNEFIPYADVEKIYVQVP
mgnify:CR=1 FL=1|tara:strand:- start:23622 stop:24152 length:531 start_codon:yes stop_codon:yes gene_type:complete